VFTEWNNPPITTKKYDALVLDTNIIISGLFWQGPPRTILRSATFQDFVMLMSVELLAELQIVLSRDKFKAVCEALSKTPEQLALELHELADIVPSSNIPPATVRDPKDHIVLACAVGGLADCIVSGDNDLLVLEAYQKIPILNALQFLERLNE
jgi:uncharacterized protein